ncbi:uncharacterized protein [Triticum aestivum]|uniref:uncharacterized protein isoform X2 n=1 Tax=Triticum aestivum TaxID=4565 RepID=UPI001D0079AB|nr:uncharacterized protein LOC123190846 isoform X2 [Triticum aestivum]
MELAVWRFVFYSPPFKGVKGKHPVGVVCSSDHLEQHHIIKVPNNSAALLPSGEAMSTRTNSMYGDSMEQVEFVEQVMDDAMEVHVDMALVKTEDSVRSRKSCNTLDNAEKRRLHSLQPLYIQKIYG